MTSWRSGKSWRRECWPAWGRGRAARSTSCGRQRETALIQPGSDSIGMLTPQKSSIRKYARFDAKKTSFARRPIEPSNIPKAVHDRVVVTTPDKLEVAALVWARSVLVTQDALERVQEKAS